MTQPAAVRPFDMRLIQRGARLRRSPFVEATQRYGCRAYTVYNHMFLPSYYDDPVREYAMVPVAHAELGTELLVETPLGPAKATVVRMPFVDPRKEIPRGL